MKYRDELLVATKALAEATQAEKDAQAWRESSKAKFLELVSKTVEEEYPLKRDSVLLPFADVEAYKSEEDFVQREYPEWRFIESYDDEEKQAVVITIEEDPALVKYTFVNDETGQVFGRTFAMVGASFDAYSFADTYPELAKECITEQTIKTLDEKKAQALMAEKPETLIYFQRFSSPGTPQTRLTPIKKAKEEDQQ